MAEANQLFGQVGDDPLGTTVKSWGDTFHQGRNLSDFQFSPFQNVHRCGRWRRKRKSLGQFFIRHQFISTGRNERVYTF
jgi:hypothetical protein